MYTGPRQHFDAFGAVPLQLEGRGAVAAQPVVFYVARALSIRSQNIAGYIENEDAPVAKIDQRLVALRVSAVVDHNCFSHCRTPANIDLRR
jgi:hypothetical protein